MVSDVFRFERLDRKFERDMLEFAREFRREGDDRFDLLLDDTDGFFELANLFEHDLDLPENRVPMTYFLLFRGTRLVAMSRLRRKLVPVLLLDGGNIGYEVRGSERRRGYASEILRRTLDEARAIDLERALLTTEVSNLGSIRVIENAGGVRDTDSISEVTGESMRRYWIEL
jgi:predicted acetyltransferase